MGPELRRGLRLLGATLVGIALTLEVALLVVQDPANLPGPLGGLAESTVIPWAQDAILPLAVRVGVFDLDEAASGGTVEAAPRETAPIVPPEATALSLVVAPATSASVDREPAPAPEAPTPTTAPPTPTPAALPERIRAPAIGLDAPVVKVGLTSDGAMGTPATAHEVGWYGPSPGEEGNALLAGHVDFLLEGKPVRGSFYSLSRLKPGDEVTIVDAEGSVVRFSVVWARYYDVATAPVSDGDRDQDAEGDGNPNRDRGGGYADGNGNQERHEDARGDKDPD